MNIKVFNLENQDLLEAETFIESDELKGALICLVFAKMEDNLIILKVLQFEWYKDGVKMDGYASDLLYFDEIDQQLNGTYECRIIVKNKQAFQSQQFDLIVYKCKKCPSCRHQQLN